MEIREFSEKHHLKTKLDECGWMIIPGRFGHIYEYDDGFLGAVLMFKTPGKWTYCKRRLEQEGFKTYLDCETEGILLFDPTEKNQVKAAIREVHIRIRRKLPPEEAAKRVKQLREWREKLNWHTENVGS